MWKGRIMDAIMLAAGNSTRFGENKLLYLLDGKPVYRYMLELLYQKQKEHRLRYVVVVSQYEEILNDVRQHFKGVRAVRNPEPERGISGSLRLGLACIMGQGQEHVDAAVPGGAVSGACLFAVADQPGFSVLSLEKLLDFWQAHSYGIVAAGTAVADAKHDSSVELKNPVIFSSAYYQELLSIIGDAGGKLRMSEKMSVADYQKAADFVWIEADGAKHLPCKVPIETEPVIPVESDIVVGVAGMDALNMPLEAVCFRKEKAMELLVVRKDHRITEEDLAKILFSRQGTRKGVGSREYYIVLNKCEDAGLRERAGRIRELLLRAGAEHVACISCRQHFLNK